MSTAWLDDVRTPDVVITSTCVLDEGGFADVDSDGVEDLVLHAGRHVYSWPSSLESEEPLVWSWTEPGEPGWVDVSTPNLGTAWVQWWSFYPDGAYEYEVDPLTLGLTERGSGVEWGGDYHVGDIDGDGIPDLLLSGFPNHAAVRASTTGLSTAIPTWSDGTTGVPYIPTYVWPMGDLNHDGYDDLLVGQRTGVVLHSELHPDLAETKQWGPAQLYLGSPVGIQTEPLWTLLLPEHPFAGIGRRAASLPDERTVVVTVVTEGWYHGDLSPAMLGEIRDADTPGAFFDQLVFVAEFTPGGFTPKIAGWLDDGSGALSLTLEELTGFTGMQWIPWFADGTGFQPNANGVAVPSRWWSPPAYQVLSYFRSLSDPVEARSQAMLQMLLTVEGASFVVWGRGLQDIGPPASGVNAEGCTFTASEWVEPPGSTSTTPIEPAPPTPAPAEPDPPAQPPVVDDGRRCDCAAQPSELPIGGVFALLVTTSRRRRHL